MSTDKMTKSEFMEIVSRIMSIAGVNYEYEVAELLGMSKENFSQTKKREVFPVNKLLKVCQDKNWDFFRIRYGEANSINEDDALGFKVTEIHQPLSPDEADVIKIIRECPEALSVLKMMADMDREAQKGIQASVEKEKLLIELMKERQDRKAG